MTYPADRSVSFRGEGRGDADRAPAGSAERAPERAAASRAEPARGSSPHGAVPQADGEP